MDMIFLFFILVLKVQRKSMSFCPDWSIGGHLRFLTGVWYLGHDLDGLSYLAMNFPEVFNSLRLMKAKIELV